MLLAVNAYGCLHRALVPPPIDGREGVIKGLAVAAGRSRVHDPAVGAALDEKRVERDQRLGEGERVPATAHVDLDRDICARLDGLVPCWCSGGHMHSFRCIQRHIRTNVQTSGECPITPSPPPHLRGRLPPRRRPGLRGVLRASTSGHDPIAGRVPAGNPHDKEVHMEAVETYTSVVTVLSVALLLVVAGLAKKQLVWKAKSVPARRRRRR
jgi:hypothetical protein